MAFPILQKRDGATKKKIPEGKTLSDWASDNGLADWRTVALYNWGTVVPKEVSRALFETVGYEKGDPSAPEAIVLKPHSDADRELRVPAPYSKGNLAVDKTHTLDLRPAPAPPVAITIDKLDKWFIPGEETCALTYSLEGPKACASKVQLEIYGSNYCTASDWADGFPKFAADADLKDTPLYEHEEQSSATERAANVAIAEWKGKVTATTGALGKKTPTTASSIDRVINVAFSPYTALLRYYKDSGDRSARLELAPFWPRFKDNGDPIPESMKIRWAIRGSDRCKTTEGGGILLIYDAKDEVVFRKPLKLDDLGMLDNGFRAALWCLDGVDGKYSPGTKKNSKGGTVAIAADMPYRAQIQVHTGPGEANGLALAAMHTEVRLYVHPKTHPASLDPYVAATDASSLVLSCSRSLLATKNYNRSDGTPWTQWQLARHGFHPGPIDGSTARQSWTTSMWDFKMTVPKRRPSGSGDFTRFDVDDGDNDEVKDAIEDIVNDTDAKASHARPWFGDPDHDRSDFPFDSADLDKRLCDRSRSLIVWADDRNYYTDPAWATNHGPQGPSVRSLVNGSPQAMGNYLQDYECGDASVDIKANFIPRPWLPLSVSTPLLSKTVGSLSDEAGPFSATDLKKMSPAVGPIRVDWSFDEIDADPPADEAIDKSRYDARVTRSKAYVEATLKASQKSHARKDVHRTAKYANCPEPAGGIRPADLADYFKTVFGHAGGTTDDSLAPWKAVPDTASDTIATVVHDNLGQADEHILVDRIGASGVYFRPSTVGGDGYRVRAQVRFAPKDDYKFPNLGTLAERYPLLPQIQSASMRVWRKASLRSYVCWGPTNSWSTLKGDLFKHLAPAFLHLVYEKGDSAIAASVADFMADDTGFKDWVRDALQSGSTAPAAEIKRGLDGNISFNRERLWPWMGAEQFGVFESSDADCSLAEARKKFYGVVNDLFCLLASVFGLLMVVTIERRTGKLRGHVVVEFRAGDDYLLQQYICGEASCAKKFYFVEQSKTSNLMLGKDCPTGCGGQLNRKPTVYAGIYRCANGHSFRWKEDDTDGGKYEGWDCQEAGCGGRYKGHYTCESSSTRHAWDLEEPDAHGHHWEDYLCTLCSDLGTQDVPLKPNTTGHVTEHPAVLHAEKANKQVYTCDQGDWTGKLIEAGAGGSHTGEPCVNPGCPGKLVTSAKWVEVYTCPACSATLSHDEANGAGGALAGTEHAACTATVKGLLVRSSPPALTPPYAEGFAVHVDDRADASGYSGLPVPSIGVALGVSYDSKADAELWAHELAHNRYMQHAGGAGGAANDQHDHAVNGTFNWASINESDAHSQSWDRACLMTYVPFQASYDSARDRRHLCGKCILKIRGWKLAGITDPDDTIHD